MNDKKEAPKRLLFILQFTGLARRTADKEPGKEEEEDTVTAITSAR